MAQQAESAEFNFTMANLEALPVPEKGRKFYFDATQRNLALQVTPTGAKSFYFWRKVRGEKVRFLLGRYPDLPLKDARDRCAEMLLKVAKGDNIQEERREAREELTVSAFFEIFLNRHARPHKKSWRYDEANFRNHLAEALGNKRLTQVTASTVQRLHDKLGQERGKVITNRVLALLVVMFNKAAEWKFTPKGFEPPTRFIKKYRESSRDRFLQGSKLPHFLAALAAESNETLRDYVWLSLLTGARKANVLGMMWKDLDLTRAEWRIPETKNGESFLGFTPRGPVRVLYVDGEMPAQELQRRLLAMANGVVLPENLFFLNKSAAHKDCRLPSLSTAEGREMLEQRMNEIAPQLLILDNKSTLMSNARPH